MSRSTIIQLREKDNLNNHGGMAETPGEYAVTLDRPLKLEEGDQLAIKSCYLDTTSQSGTTITIDDTNNKFSMKHLIYLRNHTIRTDFTVTNATGITPVGDNDNSLYYLAERNGNTYNSHVYRLDTAILLCDASDAIISECDLVFQYNKPDATDPRGYVESTVTLHVAKQQALAQGNRIKLQLSSKVGTQDFGIQLEYYDTGDAGLPGINESFKLVGPHGKHGSDKNPIDYIAARFSIIFKSLTGTLGQLLYNDAFVPMEYTVKFDIPQGRYDGTGLAAYITDQLTSIDWDFGGDPKIFEPQPIEEHLPPEFDAFASRSPYITSNKQAFQDPKYGINVVVTDMFLVADTGTAILEIDQTAPTNYVIGSSQVGLIYDDDDNKFKFELLHGSIYDTNGRIAVKYIEVGTSARYRIANSNAGVAFTGFTADADGVKCSNLFIRDMGFNSSMFVTAYNPVKNDYVNIGTDIQTSTVQIVPGLNTTADLVSIDLVGLKTDTTYFTAPALGALGDIETTAVSSVVANEIKGSQTGSLNNGYFLVEISGLPNSDIVNNPNNKIQAIIGRYYSTADFTESVDGSGSIPYVQPPGPPAMISDLTVRILDPSGSNTDSVGGNNTIFLELIKATPE